MSRPDRFCHCGDIDTGTTHWSRCYVCHPEYYNGPMRKGRIVGWCERHRGRGQQCEAVAIYAGIVALGEWAQRQQAKSLSKCRVCMLGISVGHPLGICGSCLNAMRP